LVAVELDQDIPLQVQELLKVVLQLLVQRLLCQQQVVAVVVEQVPVQDQEDQEVQVVVVENVDLEQVHLVDLEHVVKEIQEDLTMLQVLVVVEVNQRQELLLPDQIVVVELVEQV
tara:strand:- start:147 stop:491 length:345 start_codon:yes stop_codon:yes gene_type:complete